MRALFPRLGADFSKLWTASAVSNLGDGITMAAGPLLVASITTDPAAVAGAVFAQQLPWLLFALLSGAWADRLDRRRLVVTVNLVRAAALAGLVAATATDQVTVPVIYAVFFLLGTGETLSDTASSAFVPALVPSDRLPTANAWLGATFTVINQFAAKPLGAWLFVIAAAVPFGVNALTFAASAALIASIRSLPAPPARTRTSLRADIAEGVRWLWRHRLLRTLAVTMAFSNVIYCAAFAIFVLYAFERLGLGQVGYGVLLTAFAVGGLAGTVVAPRLLTTVDTTLLLRAGLFVEVALHGTLALTRNPFVAAAMIVVFGVHTMIWGNIVITLRQRAVPAALYGRVTSVYSLLDLGGAALGSLLGGAVAQAYGIVATFGTASAAMAVVLLLAWRSLGAGVPGGHIVTR
ncbi:MFS transporter [Actinoplanes friuliensis]|uniref:Major facilitator transporter n=1 Tax=Actinoplanes friuliensis DSM 7358 TaxID=1246995 RepID=U5VQN1_9ACTN|nr:MFS transporter [Actinoplanes friuliensis]AGZ39097.1 major facilitator transporter [Actinoplanes friuliensis DSM 7358]